MYIPSPSPVGVSVAAEVEAILGVEAAVILVAIPVRVGHVGGALSSCPTSSPSLEGATGAESTCLGWREGGREVRGEAGRSVPSLAVSILMALTSGSGVRSGARVLSTWL